MKPGTLVGPEFPNYAQEYDASLKRVMRAFRSPQLILLANQLGYKDKLPRTQREVAQILLERSWGWPSPHILEQKSKDHPVAVTTGSLYSNPSISLL